MSIGVIPSPSSSFGPADLSLFRGSACEVLDDGLLRFVVLHLGIHFPDVGLVRSARDNVIHGDHRGEHGMVLVVVLMHAVAADQKEILKAVQVFAYLVKTFVGPKI